MNAIKKVSASLVACALSASAFAAQDLDTRVHDLEKKVDMMSTTTVMGTFGPQTALARPDPHGQGFFITFDVLYAHANVGGTEYAYTNAYQPNGLFPRAVGRLKGIDFDWDWGLKAGIGYNMFHDGWELYAQYTYFDSDGDAKIGVGGPSALIPVRGNNAIGQDSETGYDYIGQGDAPFNYATHATASFDFDFDSVDVELARNAFVSRSLSFRPHIGLKSVWLDIDQRTRYSGGTGAEVQDDNDAAVGLGYNTAHVNDKNKLWGLGPRTGFNSKWYLTNGFSIFGDAAASFLYGYFETKHRNYYSLNPDIHQVRIKSKFHKFVPMAEIALGLAFDKYIYNDKQHIGVSLGYQVQYLWRANQTIKPDWFLYSPGGVGTVDENMTYTRYSEDASIHMVDLRINWSF